MEGARWDVMNISMGLWVCVIARNDGRSSTYYLPNNDVAGGGEEGGGNGIPGVESWVQKSRRQADLEWTSRKKRGLSWCACKRKAAKQASKQASVEEEDKPKGKETPKNKSDKRNSIKQAPVVAEREQESSRRSVWFELQLVGAVLYLASGLLAGSCVLTGT